MDILIYGGVIIAIAVLLMISLSLKLKIRRYTVLSDKVSRGFKAVHLSDLHESRFGEKQQKLLDTMRREAPDVIFVTGDMVEDGKAYEDQERIMSEGNAALELLDELVKIAPVYMVYGNHESNIPGTDKLTSEIEALGVNIMHRNGMICPDMVEETEICGNRLVICGADDPYFYKTEVRYRRRGIKERFREDKDTHGCGKDRWRQQLRTDFAEVGSEGRLTLLLSHRPEEHRLYRELGFDAAFSGHAHGGQWRLPPFINGIYAPNQGIFPTHAGGIYRYDGFTHIVSRGLSKKRMIRIFNPPEICVVTFSHEIK